MTDEIALRILRLMKIQCAFLSDALVRIDAIRLLLVDRGCLSILNI